MPSRIELPESSILNFYTLSGMSATKIGKLFSVTRIPIIRILKKHCVNIKANLLSRF
jgi:DNA-directed RNA polymerase specialized sigma subunit